MENDEIISVPKNIYLSLSLSPATATTATTAAPKKTRSKSIAAHFHHPTDIHEKELFSGESHRLQLPRKSSFDVAFTQSFDEFLQSSQEVVPLVISIPHEIENVEEEANIKTRPKQPRRKSSLSLERSLNSSFVEPWVPETIIEEDKENYKVKPEKDALALFIPAKGPPYLQQNVQNSKQIKASFDEALQRLPKRALTNLPSYQTEKLLLYCSNIKQAEKSRRLSDKILISNVIASFWKYSSYEFYHPLNLMGLTDQQSYLAKVKNNFMREKLIRKNQKRKQKQKTFILNPQEQQHQLQQRSISPLASISEQQQSSQKNEGETERDHHHQPIKFKSRMEIFGNTLSKHDTIINASIFSSIYADSSFLTAMKATAAKRSKEDNSSAKSEGTLTPDHVIHHQRTRSNAFYNIQRPFSMDDIRKLRKEAI